MVQPLTFDGAATERVADLERSAEYLRAEVVRYTTTGRVSVKTIRLAAENMEHQARMWRPYLPLLSRGSYAAVLRDHAEGAGTIAADDPTARLSRAEWRVLFGLCEGLTNPEIAKAIGRSPHTVRNHSRSIYEVMDVRSRTELVAKVARLGLLPPASASAKRRRPSRLDARRRRRRSQLDDDGGAL